MLAFGCRLTGMSCRRIRVSLRLVTRLERRDGKVPGLFLAKRNARPEETEFHRVTTDSRTGEFDFSALNEPQHHQALNLRIRWVNRCYDAFLAAP